MSSSKALRAYEELLKAFILETIGSTISTKYKAPRTDVAVCEYGCAEREYRKTLREMRANCVDIGYSVHYSLNEKSIVRMFYDVIYPELLGLDRCVPDEELGIDMCMEVLDAGYGYIYFEIEKEYIDALKEKYEDWKRNVKPLVLMENVLRHLVMTISYKLSLVTTIPLILDYTVYGIMDDEGVIKGFLIEYSLVPMVVSSDIARKIYDSYKSREKEKQQSRGG